MGLLTVTQCSRVKHINHWDSFFVSLSPSLSTVITTDPRDNCRTIIMSPCCHYRNSLSHVKHGLDSNLSIRSLSVTMVRAVCECQCVCVCMCVCIGCYLSIYLSNGRCSLLSVISYQTNVTERDSLSRDININKFISSIYLRSTTHLSPC